MGKIVISVPDELEEKFRQKAFKRFGPKRGFLLKAIVEAMKEWLEK